MSPRVQLKVMDNMSNVLMSLSGVATDWIMRRVSTIDLKLKNVLRRVSTQTKNESQVANLRIRTAFKGDDSETLQTAPARRAVLHSCVA